MLGQDGVAMLCEPRSAQIVAFLKLFSKQQIFTSSLLLPMIAHLKNVCKTSLTHQTMLIPCADAAGRFDGGFSSYSKRTWKARDLFRYAVSVGATAGGARQCEFHVNV